MEPGPTRCHVHQLDERRATGVAEFAPGTIGHHGGRWAVYRATWSPGDAAELMTSWSELQALERHAWDITLFVPTRLTSAARPRQSRADRLTQLPHSTLGPSIQIDGPIFVA